MKKTTFAAFGAFALLAVSAPAQAADVPMWEQLATGVKPAAEVAPVAIEETVVEDIVAEAGFDIVPVQAEEKPAAPAKLSLWDQLTGKDKAPVATKKTIIAPAPVAAAQPVLPKGALIEFAAVPTPVVIEIREQKAAASQAVAQEVQTQAQEIAAASEIAVDEAVGEIAPETVAVQEEAPVVESRPKKLSLWDQLTGKDKKAASVKAAESYAAPVAEAPVAMEAQNAVAQGAAVLETPVPLWEKLAVQ